MAFGVNGLSESGDDYRILGETADGALKEYSSGWSLTREDGTEIGADAKLSPEQIYEIRITVTRRLGMRPEQR